MAKRKEPKLSRLSEDSEEMVKIREPAVEVDVELDDDDEVEDLDAMEPDEPVQPSEPEIVVKVPEPAPKNEESPPELEPEPAPKNEESPPEPESVSVTSETALVPKPNVDVQVPKKVDPSLVPKPVPPRAKYELVEAASLRKHGRTYIGGRTYYAVGEEQILYFERDGHFKVTRLK